MPWNSECHCTAAASRHIYALLSRLRRVVRPVQRALTCCACNCAVDEYIRRQPRGACAPEPRAPRHRHHARQLLAHEPEQHGGQQRGRGFDRRLRLLVPARAPRCALLCAPAHALASEHARFLVNAATARSDGDWPARQCMRLGKLQIRLADKLSGCLSAVQDAEQP
jgi:hypothetical protein